MSTEYSTSEAARDAYVAAPRTSRLQRLRYPLISVGAVLAFVVVWWVVAELEIWRPLFVPPPQDVWDQLIRTSTTHDGQVGYAGEYLWEHLWSSMLRLFQGLALGVIIGVPLGLALGSSRTIAAILHPGVTVIRSLPPLAYFSLLIIWFGIDETPKLVLLVIAAMPPIIVSTVAGIESVHKDYINGARSLGAGRWALVRFVLFPASLPEIFTGIRLGVGVAYTSVVAAETVNGVPGLGGMIRDAQRYNQTDLVILGILVLGLTGLLLEALLTWLQRRASPWRGLA